jgi:hypothetical protein
MLPISVTNFIKIISVVYASKTERALVHIYNISKDGLICGKPCLSYSGLKEIVVTLLFFDGSRKGRLKGLEQRSPVIDSDPIALVLPPVKSIFQECL